MPPPRLAALALLLLPLAGCGAPGRSPQGDVARGEAALEAGRLAEAEEILAGAAAASVGPGLDSSLRRRALRALVATRLARGLFDSAQQALYELRGLGERGPEVARQAARLALVTGRDLARSRRDLRETAESAEDEAMLARLGRRLGEAAPAPAPSSHAPARSTQSPSRGDQARLLALEQGRPDPAPGAPAATPELEAELLARQLDAGPLSPDHAARLAALRWPARAAWLQARLAWLATAPEDPRPDLFQELRWAGPAAPDARLRLLAAVRGPDQLPTGKRLPVSRPGGQLVDRDPVSPRRRADDRPRVLVAVWPGLSLRYLRASLEAGHFPYLRAWANRGALVEVPASAALLAPPDALPPPRPAPPDRPEARRRRLFPEGVPEPEPSQAVAELLAFDRQLEVRTQLAALHHEEHRPALLWMDLPSLDGLRPWLLPLLVDCPPPGPLARQLADEVGGFGDTLDRLVRRLEVWAGRMVPMIDRDDHVLVASPGGQAGEGGFLLVVGPGLRVERPTRSDFSLEDLGALAAWLSAGREGPPPKGAEAFLRERLQSPFQG